MQPFIKPFEDISLSDIPIVGGKNASLGEMISQLSSKGIRVPAGFATTAEAFWYFIDTNSLRKRLFAILSQLDTTNYHNLRSVGAEARALMMGSPLPADLAKQIADAYKTLGKGQDIAVAVRSSATAEDLPEASFAGQHESYLNINGDAQVINAVHRCFASLFTDRAIKYREDNGFPHDKIALSAGVQQMVRAGKACAGIAFTLEPESGFREVVHISGAWGLGENIVQGTVTPDEYILFKPSLRSGKKAIVHKRKGAKEKMMIYGEPGGEATVNIDTPPALSRQFVLGDGEIEMLGRWCMQIEEHYGKPMDIEWAKDSQTGELFILQARPETVRSREDVMQLIACRLLETGTVLATGEAIGSKIVSGIARVLHDTKDADKLKEGEIIVTELTSPDWDPILKKAGGIITDKGGRTSHASIVARELGVPAVIGTASGTANIRDGQTVTINCAAGKKGVVYESALKFVEEKTNLAELKMPRHTEAMMIMSDPDKAFKLSFYPNHGVGLVRIEFIITHEIQAHPMALLKFDELKDADAKSRIEELTIDYKDKRQYFIDKLSRGVATIAAAFHPKDVIVRMSDFKSNEYANLIGGKEFEPVEENPMIGFRGASRYYHPRYKDGFMLECEAMRVVRDDMGLDNVKLMIPFCRTVEEGRKVVDIMRQAGLVQGVNGLRIYVMAEIPSNVLQAADFAEIFDGFSIGSNDLTQLTLGIDRDSAIIADLFDERNKAAMTMVANMIDSAKTAGRKIGLCGQAPSDYPEFARFLVQHGINSVSFNPDALLTGIQNIVAAE